MGVFRRLTKLWFDKLDPDSMRFIDRYLDEPGKFLFWQMNGADQYHALAVARTILSLASNLPEQPLKILVEAALLHDIGKVEGDLNPWSRLIVALVRRLLPRLRGRLAKIHRNSFWGMIRYGCYVDLIHPARGAHMAQLFGIEPFVVEMIRRHHDPPRKDQSLALTWLQLADSRN